MKIIQYEILGYTDVWNAETEETEQKECVSSVTVECRTQAEFDAAYPAVEASAIPGSIAVTGAFAESPTQMDMIEAQVTYTAMMTDTLLEV